MKETRIAHERENSNYTFLTQKERDIESDLDFFNARYYSSALGRFTSADTFGGKLTNPQSLNLYSYVMNNPLKWIDPTGHRAQDPNDPIKPTEDKDENGETIYVETDPEIIKIDSKKPDVITPSSQMNLVGITCKSGTDCAIKRSIADPSAVVPGGGIVSQGGKGLGSLFVRFFNWLFGRTTTLAKASSILLRLTPGTKQIVNPALLRAGNRRTLERWRIDRLKKYLDEGGDISAVDEPLKVTKDGVIIQGHHRARLAAERGMPLEVEVVDGVMDVGPPVTELPVIP